MGFKEEREDFFKIINIRLANFDYKKMEIYKPAIDDGFILSAFISGIEYVNIRKEYDFYSFKLEDTYRGETVKTFRLSNWEEFKEKIRITFEGDEEDDF